MEFIIGTLLWLVWVVALNVVFKGVLKVGFWGAISDAPQLSSWQAHLLQGIFILALLVPAYLLIPFGSVS